MFEAVAGTVSSSETEGNGDIAIDDIELRKDFCEYEGELQGNINKPSSYLPIPYFICFKHLLLFANCNLRGLSDKWAIFPWPASPS